MAAPTSYSVNRLVRGTVDVESYPAASGQQINVGDHVLFFSGNVYPAQAVGAVLTWNSGSEIQNWSGARALYMGCSLGQFNSYSTISGAVPVALCGTFEYPYPSSSGVSQNPGTFVSFTQDPVNGTAGSGYFAPQALMQCSGQATAIGKIVDPFTPQSSGTGLVTVYLQSFVAKGGIAN